MSHNYYIFVGERCLRNIKLTNKLYSTTEEELNEDYFFPVAVKCVSNN